MTIGKTEIWRHEITFFIDSSGVMIAGFEFLFAAISGVLKADVTITATDIIMWP